MASGIGNNRPVSTLPAAAQGAGAAPEPPAAPTGSEGGIVVNDHPVLRNLLRFGGLAAAVGGIGAIGYRMMTSGGGINSVGSIAAPAGIAAAIGAAALLGSFAVKPDIKPFLKGNLPDFNTAVVEATKFHDDVAIYHGDDGRFGIVDFRDRDFDNEELDDLKLGNKHIPWAGLVSQDGDLLRLVDGDRYQDMGRAFPPAIKASDLNPTSPADLGKLVGETIGTSDDHRPARIGRQVGDATGYPTYADAAKAAYDASGNNAVVKLGTRYFLFDAALPAGVGADYIAARGTGVSPVNVLEVQEGKKLFRASAPGNSLDFVSRAIPFVSSEPIGHSIGVHTIDRLMQSFNSRSSAVSMIPSSPSMVDAVWDGRIDGYAVLRGTGPGVADSFHLYQFGPRLSKGAWDQQLGGVEALLQREHDSRVDYVQTGYTEYDATIYRDTYDRTQVVLHDNASGDHVLRTTGWRMVGHEIDWLRTNSLRDQLHRERVDRERRDTDTGTSPGDDYGSGGSGTSPGDDYDSGSSGSGTSPGDDYDSGSSGSGTSPGDDYDSGSSDSGTSPGDD